MRTGPPACRHAAGLRTPAGSHVGPADVDRLQLVPADPARERSPPCRPRYRTPTRRRPSRGERGTATARRQSPIPAGRLRAGSTSRTAAWRAPSPGGRDDRHRIARGDISFSASGPKIAFNSAASSVSNAIITAFAASSGVAKRVRSADGGRRRPGVNRPSAGRATSPRRRSRCGARGSHTVSPEQDFTTWHRRMPWAPQSTATAPAATPAPTGSTATRAAPGTLGLRAAAALVAAGAGARRPGGSLIRLRGGLPASPGWLARFRCWLRSSGASPGSTARWTGGFPGWLALSRSWRRTDGSPDCPAHWTAAATGSPASWTGAGPGCPGVLAAILAGSPGGPRSGPRR